MVPSRRVAPLIRQCEFKLMSAMGHEQKSPPVVVMSGLLLEADFLPYRIDVRFGPEADIANFGPVCAVGQC